MSSSLRNGRLKDHHQTLREMRAMVTGQTGHQARAEKRALDWALQRIDVLDRVTAALRPLGR